MNGFGNILFGHPKYPTHTHICLKPFLFYMKLCSCCRLYVSVADVHDGLLGGKTLPMLVTGRVVSQVLPASLAARVHPPRVTTNEWFHTYMCVCV